MCAFTHNSSTSFCKRYTFSTWWRSNPLFTAFISKLHYPDWCITQWLLRVTWSAKWGGILIRGGEEEGGGWGCGGGGKLSNILFRFICLISHHVISLHFILPFSLCCFFWISDKSKETFTLLNMENLFCHQTHSEE